jgi:hypothetical protein
VHLTEFEVSSNAEFIYVNHSLWSSSTAPLFSHDVTVAFKMSKQIFHIYICCVKVRITQKYEASHFRVRLLELSLLEEATGWCYFYFFDHLTMNRD